MQKLGVFLLEEIHKRQTSITKFAKEVGVSTQTIANIINGEGDYPRIQTLMAIAEYTGVSVNQLFSLTVGQDAVRAEAYILAQRIIDLPPEKQQLIFDLLSGIAFNQANSSS
jgi:transcriptional regulator with XRE-family HTH domain